VRRQVFVLFRVPNRCGLGNLMRSTNLGRAILERRPESRVVLLCRTLPPASLRAPGLEYVEAPDANDLGRIPPALAEAAPDVVVDDTILPHLSRDDVAYLASTRVFVLPRGSRARHRAILEDPALPSIQRIVVPHTHEEFGRALPDDVGLRARMTGPVVRLPRPEILDGLRARYGLDPKAPTLVSTAGGDVAHFAEVVGAVHRALRLRIPEARHVAVAGPDRGSELPALPGLVTVGVEPDLVSLLHVSDAVLAPAGYNTIAEIRATRTPAFLVPDVRRNDDQFERAGRLEAIGAARLFPRESVAEIASTVSRCVASPAALEEMRRAHAARPLVPGNRYAAAWILGEAA
jgi:UDP:flavonoid glycosyltransferase YjiC (YdhE family)